MRVARAAVLGLSLALSLLTAASASATGPGGWDHLGAGATGGAAALNGRVDTLISVPHFGAIPDSVYAGGVFTSAGGNTSAVAIARWDGTAWHSIGAPPISTATGAGVAAIAVDPVTGKVYVGGNFTNAGGNPNADFLAVWDGAALEVVLRADHRERQGAPDHRAVALHRRRLRRRRRPGLRRQAGELRPRHRRVVLDGHRRHARDQRRRLRAHRRLGRPALRRRELRQHRRDHRTRTTSRCTTARGTRCRPARCDGITRSIASDGTNVYIGSDAVDIAGIARADHVAKWNGTMWSALGANAANTDGWLPATAFDQRDRHLRLQRLRRRLVPERRRASHRRHGRRVQRVQLGADGLQRRRQRPARRRRQRDHHLRRPGRRGRQLHRRRGRRPRRLRRPLSGRRPPADGGHPARERRLLARSSGRRPRSTEARATATRRSSPTAGPGATARPTAAARTSRTCSRSRG